jgi:hypothetical protein
VIQKKSPLCRVNNRQGSKVPDTVRHRSKLARGERTKSESLGKPSRRLARRFDGPVKLFGYGERSDDGSATGLDGEIHQLRSELRDSSMATRRRIVHTTTFEARMADEAKRLKAAAEKEGHGSKARELLLKRARQIEAASHMSQWLSSPGLQPPD